MEPPRVCSSCHGFHNLSAPIPFQIPPRLPILAAGKQRGKERGADGEGEGAMPVFKEEEEEEAESWTPAILILSVHSCFCFWLTDL